MNINPEVMGRLKRLASSALKKNDTQRNSGSVKHGDADKEKELERNPNHNKDEETYSGTNGRTSCVLSRKNETENDAVTLKSKETIKNSEMNMDMDTFRQMLKEVIVKRTLEVERRIMGDVEVLKKQILSLEAEKKTLQMDAERLQQTLNEISSKHERVKGNQRSPQIGQLKLETSAPAKLSTTNPSQRADSTHQVATVTVEIANRVHVGENRGVLENVKTSETRRLFDSNVRSYIAKQLAARQAATGTVGNSNMSSEQTTPGPPTRSPPQRPQKNSDTSQMYVRESESAYRHSPEILIEEPRSLERPRSHPPARPEVPLNRQMPTQGQPAFQRQTSNGVSTSPPTITSPVQGRFSSQPQWHHPTHLGNPSNRLQMSQSSQAGDVSSHPYSPLKRGPPNVTLFGQPNKRRRGVKQWNDDGFHVVASDNNYVMHNFKVKPTPKVIPKGIPRAVAPVSRRPLQPKPIVSIPEAPQGNQAVYTTSPSSQLPRPYLNQGFSNFESIAHPSPLQPNQPPGQIIRQQPPSVQPVVHSVPHPIHETGNASVHSPRLSQGQLVSYPSSRPRQGSTEYGPRVTPATPQPPQRVEPAHTYGQPTDTNGTVYVVREYQLSQQGVPIQTAHGPPPNRAVPFQQPTQALPGVPRSQPHPPVQSPGISSTASPSGRHPGNPNVGSDQRGAVSQSEALVAANDAPGVPLKTPPKPSASIVVVQDGIVLSWNMRLDEAMAKIDNYELFACQDGAESTNPPIMWKKIGIVKALPLPMACTLSQFSSGNKYHFAVRAVDDQERAGPFSDPCTISLTK